MQDFIVLPKSNAELVAVMKSMFSPLKKLVCLCKMYTRVVLIMRKNLQMRTGLFLALFLVVLMHQMR